MTESREPVNASSPSGRDSMGNDCLYSLDIGMLSFLQSNETLYSARSREGKERVNLLTVTRLTNLRVS